LHDSFLSISGINLWKPISLSIRTSSSYLVRVPHDTLADCESTQDIIGVPEDEANIVKKCVTCSSSDFYDVSFLVCPMEDRLMLIDVYTTVYTTTSIAMYVCANCCYDYAYYGGGLVGVSQNVDNNDFGHSVYIYNDPI
jgi:hypothetical protein